MRPIGFSTGALAYSDFRRGVEITRNKGIKYVELSALRQEELAPLSQGLKDLDLSSFVYVSIHAPSKIRGGDEELVVETLEKMGDGTWPIILHPDAVNDFSLWRRFGTRLCVENMDKRKSIGRTSKELKEIFAQLPEASFCFDIGHARQVDPAMNVAHFLLKEFASRLRQIHLSEVNSRSTHDALSYASILAFQEIADAIPEQVPTILETPVPEDQIESELEHALEALTARERVTTAL